METFVFDNVSFCYPCSAQKALVNVNLKVMPSEFLVICGKSGCGKSTLLRHMKKNLTPYGDLEGTVFYKGTPVYALDERTGAAEIGFVQQNPENQIVTDKVWHELAFGLESLGMKREIIRRRVSEMACFFGIQAWFRRPVYELSGGQKQLLNLASVMAMQPQVLILDEPTSQLDPIAATEFLETVQKINRELGTTVILSEHRLEEAFPMADRIAVMERGGISICDSAGAVGQFLGGRRTHPMFLGLPTPMKVYCEVRPRGPCPVTVREGRLWLDNLLEGKTLSAAPADNPVSKEKEAGLAVEVQNVFFRYERDGFDFARDLSLKIRRGEWYCIVGGNGVGKTTALRLMTGFLKPYRGKIRINGKDIGRYSKNALYQNNLGILPQNPQALFTEITVREELYDVLQGRGLSSKEMVRTAEEMLALLALSGLEEAHPYDLSGGEQQRLALGKVLLTDPKILFLDEPTKGIDPFFKTVLGGILKKLNQKGITICMISHDIEFCAEYADRCGMFFDGAITSEDAAKEFFGENSFYTTAANRMSRHLISGAVTYRDVVRLCEQNLI